MKVKILTSDPKQYTDIKAYDTSTGLISIDNIIPTSFYLSAGKRSKLIDFYKNNGSIHNLPPISLTIINNKILLIDGHHRLTTSIQNGEEIINGNILQIDDISEMNLYDVLSKKVIENNILVKNLSNHLLDHDKYINKWIGFCTKIYNNKI